MGLAFDTGSPSSQIDEGPSSVYREYPPPAELAPYLVCAWTLDIASGGRAHRQRVLPDACSDIVWIGDRPPIVVGAMTQASLSTTTGATSLVGLRFRPESGARVFGIRADELTDRQVGLDQVWRRQASNDLSERVLERREAKDRAAAAYSFLMSRRDRVAAIDRVVQRSVMLLGASRGDRIGEVAREVGISERQLRRRFLESVGYSPKLFQRVVRFQRLLAITQARPSIGLADAALLAGYADQPHMTREVAELSGVPPSALLGHAVGALALSELIRG